MQLAALDWIILAILLLSMALGAWRGLVYEVLSVLGWFAAFVAAHQTQAAVAVNRSGVLDADAGLGALGPPWQRALKLRVIWTSLDASLAVFTSLWIFSRSKINAWAERK